MKAANYSSVHSRLAELLAAAAAAEKRYDHQSAIALYTAAFDLPDLTPQERYSILYARARAYDNGGDLMKYAADSDALIALARQLDDKQLLAETLAVSVWRLWFRDPQTTSALAREAMAYADGFGDDRLLACANLAMAVSAFDADEAAQDRYSDAALIYARRSSDRTVLFESLSFRCLSFAQSNRLARAMPAAVELWDLALESGSLYEQIVALNLMGQAAVDLAQQRASYEQALALAKIVDRRFDIMRLSNNMALLMWKLGLYGRALDLAEEALSRAEELDLQWNIINNLESVGRACLAKGDLQEAAAAFQRGLDMSDRPGSSAFHAFGLGRVKLAAGDLNAAARCFRQSIDSWDAMAPVAHAYLAAVHLANGDPDQALAQSNAAISVLEAGRQITEYHTQEIWFQYYKVLKVLGNIGAFAALDRATQTMLASVDSLSDEGLRRNYLNKVPVNRQITLTWPSAAAERGIALDPFTAHEPPAGNLRDQFRRVVEIGARLSAQHDPDTLAEFIVEEFVEMSGAERVLLLILDENGNLQPAASFDPQDALDLARPLLDSLSHERRPLLRQDVGDVPDGEVHEIHQRSLIALPLITQGKLLGMLYGDMRQIFGRFDDADLHLLGMLANQAAAALQNAALVSNLEAQVEERTADLQQRVLELGIINNVSSGLAARLDFQKIVDSVGERLYEVFHADTTFIALIDEERGIIEFPYYNEHGFHHEVVLAFGEGFTSVVIAENRPLHLNMRDEQVKYGMVVMQSPGEEDDLNESILAVPILAGDRVIGAASVQRHAKYAYDENDLRLLQTLAANLGVALENARLFDETQQRSSELAIINSVQAGVAAKLDLQAIFDVVGDKLSEIYEGDSISLATYDAVTDLANTVYLRELGERLTLEPHKPGEIGRRALRTHQALLLRARSDYEAMGVETIKGTTPALSGMYVPLVLGDKLVGHLSVESNTLENAYDDADLRLLTTLANSMSVALENARLFDETQQRNNELAVINTVQDGLVAELSLDAIFEVVGQKLAEIYPQDSISLYSLDQQNGLAIPRFNLEGGKRLELRPFVHGPIGRILIEEKRPVMINSTAEFESIGAITVGDSLPSQSGMFVPLITGDKVVGNLNIESPHHEHAYDENDLRLLTSLANSMSVALENARLFDETQQRNNELAIINSVQEGLAAELDLVTIYEIVGERLSEIYPEDGILLRKYDHAAGLVHDYYAFERGERYENEPYTPGPIMNYTRSTRKPLLLRTRAEAEAIGAVVIPGTEAERSGMYVSLYAGERYLGDLSVYNLDRENAYDEADLRLLSTLASSMGAALENARLFAETTRRAREMASLAEVGRDISATLKLQDVLQRIAGHALEMLGVSDSALFLPAEDGQTMHGFVALGDVAEEVLATTITPGQGLLGDIWQNRLAEIINDANEDPRSVRIAGTPERDEERMMVAPLLTGRDVVGLMVVWRGGAPFVAEDLHFLDGLARQAAIAIQNARLFSEAEIAKEEAEKANATKSRFLANMSHELRTPLNAIIGFTRIIKRKTRHVAPEKQLDNMDKVLASAEHLLGLINTILDIAKIEAGRMDVVNSRFQVAPLIDLCATTTQPLLNPGVKLKQEIAPGLPPLVSDQDKLKQILLNLLSNAAKFTHEGAITIHADRVSAPPLSGAERRLPDGSETPFPLLVINIIDTGIGMDEEQLGRVFEEFQQASASTTRQYGGTGLGLPISKQLAQLLGGDLTAESSPGDGTTFTLVLPWEAQSSEQGSVG